MKNNKEIENFLNESRHLLEIIDKEEIDKVIEILFEAWKNDKHVFSMGNGGSASTATHFASDLSKTVATEGKKRFKSIGLTDNIPLMSAWINDTGFENLFTGQLENMMEDGDVLVGFSVHGGSGSGDAGIWSQNMLKAIKFAKEKGAKTIGLSGYDGGIMKKMCDACIVVPIESTPHVEGFHVVLNHLIIFTLKEKIKNYTEKIV